MCDRCLRIAKMKEDYNKMQTREQINENLVDNLIRAASDNNEFDNRKEIEMLRKEVLKRMR